jgi:hypothetical protein
MEENNVEQINDVKNVNTKPYHIPGRSQQIVDLKMANPNLTLKDIATITDCDVSNVSRTLQRYNIDADNLQGYKNHKADILAGLQDKLLSSVSSMSTADIQKASMKDRIVSAAILHDKELDIRQPGRDSQPMVIINQIQIKTTSE